MIPRLILCASLATFAAIGLSACESTQSRSAELEKKGEKALLVDSSPTIGKESKVVKVTSSTLLTDSYGSAVVVRLHNSSDQNLVDVPIQVEVLDSKGRTVYSNEIPGIETELAAVPYIPAGGDATWVNDQVQASGVPASVRVKVGASSRSYAGPMPEIEVSAPRIEGDPVSGVEATGTVVNRTGEDQERLLLYAVGTKGGKVVAAGRGAIEHLKGTTKPLHYDIFFIGDPKGSEIEMTQYPTLPGSEAE